MKNKQKIFKRIFTCVLVVVLILGDTVPSIYQNPDIKNSEKRILTEIIEKVLKHEMVYAEDVHVDLYGCEECEGEFFSYDIGAL